MIRLIVVIFVFALPLFPAAGPYGSVVVFDDITYVVVDDPAIMNTLYREISTAQFSPRGDDPGLMVDTAAAEIRRGINLYYGSSSGMTLIPLTGKSGEFKRVLGFWPNKEIICETLPRTGEPERFTLLTETIYLHRINETDFILVACQPCGREELIRSAYGRTFAALGGFREAYKSSQLAESPPVPPAVEAVHRHWNDLTIHSEDLGKPGYSHFSDVVPLRVQNSVYGKPDWLYVAVISGGYGDNWGHLILLDGDGVILDRKWGYVSIRGVQDLDRNGTDELVLIWGSPHYREVQILTPAGGRPLPQLVKRASLPTFWD